MQATTRAADPKTTTTGALNSDGMPLRVVLLGNPNTGKTTLFNRLTGLRHKTSNFPGTTLEARSGSITLTATTPRANEAEGRAGLAGGPVRAEIVDLPGIYSLELDQMEAGVCRDVLAGRTAPRGEAVAEPHVLCVVVDSTNLARNLTLVGESLRRRLPTVIALNMTDLAERSGCTIDTKTLETATGCRAVRICARSGQGIDQLLGAIATATIPTHTPPGTSDGLTRWAEELAVSTTSVSGEQHDQTDFTERVDHVLTHPVWGGLVFVMAMAGLFALLFSVATIPMDLIELIFSTATDWTKSVMPEGILRDLISDGVIAGIGATVVFLPQICLLFFVISLLEDTGYLARAAFMMDRLLRPFGLPGHAFVPLLSSHACALPGIMACRGIPDRRERLATILVAPFMTCSARLPVYVLLVGILFPQSPALAALALVGCYGLGIAAGMLSALVARRTILRGAARPMALELPSYKRPSLRTAWWTTYDRALVFLKKAGTNILAISIVLWWLSSYPHVPPPRVAEDLRESAKALRAVDRELEFSEIMFMREVAMQQPLPAPDPTQIPTAEWRVESADAYQARAETLDARHAAASSFAGRLGRFIQPVLAPLGYDWQLSIGVLSSFAAREVFVTTMAVITTGSDDDGDEGVLQQVASATRDDGITPVFTRAVSWSLLVYYVLAMQCLPTLAVTARESGSWKWAMVQLAWMSLVAYVGAMVVFQVLR